MDKCPCCGGSKELQESADRVTRYMAEQEQYKRDAERYRWLRNHYIADDYGTAWFTFKWKSGLDGGGSYEATMDLRRAELDAAIDRAREPSDTCPDCLGNGKQCLAGHSAHPANWYTCETCGGTGKAPGRKAGV